MTGLPIEVPPNEVAALPSAARRAFRLQVDQGKVVAEVGQAALIWFSLFVVYGSQRPLSHFALVGITVAAGIWLVSLRCAELPGRIVLGRAVSASIGTATGLVVITALNAAITEVDISPAILAGSTLGVFTSVTVWGWFVDLALASRRRVLFVGTDGVDDLLTRELQTSAHPRYDVVGAIPGAEELTEIVEAQHPDIVVLTDEESYAPAIDRLLDARSDVRVAGLENFLEYAFGRVPIDQITPAWFMSLLHPRQRIYTRFTKRTFDIAVATILLVLAAPVMAVLAIATKLGGGSVLYRQTRLGEGGRRFTIYKFRTMSEDAEQAGAVFAQEHDTRVTRVGGFLRRTHLDELPQLWNVLKGDMSVVGPRPERPEWIEMIEEAVPFWNRRLLVKPGITGWAQVRCGYASDCDDMETKLSYDLWYLRNRSLLVDLAVCAMTMFALFGGPAGSRPADPA